MPEEETPRQILFAFCWRGEEGALDKVIRYKLNIAVDGPLTSLTCGKGALDKVIEVKV